MLADVAVSSDRPVSGANSPGEEARLIRPSVIFSHCAGGKGQSGL